MTVMLAGKRSFSGEEDESFFLELSASPAVFLLRGDGEPYVSKTANLRRRLQRLLGPPAEQSKRLNLRDRVREIEFTLAGSDFELQLLLYHLLREAFPKTYAARLRLRPAPLVKLHLENEYPRASVATRLGRIGWFETTGRTSGAKAPSLGGPIATTAEPCREANVDKDTAYSRADSRLVSPQGHGWNSRPSSSSEAGAPGMATASLSNLYYGPFFSRAAAEKFASDALDFFKMRRCVEDLHPDPAFPGCVYSEMKMCLAPCFKGCTDAEYHTEVSRVQQFFDTQGESLARELAEQRDRASAALAFEGASAIHAKLDKLKPLLSQLPEIVKRLDRLQGLIIQPGARMAPEGEGAHPSVSLFLFRSCALHGPVEFSIAAVAESRSMESRVEEAIASVAAEPGTNAVRMEHLAILKRWYYRSTRVGEIFFADEKGNWPMRRIVRGIGRVSRGEKAQEVTPAAPQS